MFTCSQTLLSETDSSLTNSFNGDGLGAVWNELVGAAWPPRQAIILYADYEHVPDDPVIVSPTVDGSMLISSDVVSASSDFVSASSDLRPERSDVVSASSDFVSASSDLTPESSDFVSASSDFVSASSDLTLE
eukprot:gene6314-2938_t